MVYMGGFLLNFRVTLTHTVSEMDLSQFRHFFTRLRVLKLMSRILLQSLWFNYVSECFICAEHRKSGSALHP